MRHTHRGVFGAGQRLINASVLLEARSELYRKIRAYFGESGALEADVPSLGLTAVTDVNLCNMQVETALGRRFLQTSPEYYLKRLLCRCPQDIYSLGHAYRDEPKGRFHNPEFSMLEWYRVGVDDRYLMRDVEELICALLPNLEIHHFSYAELFLEQLNINPHLADQTQLNQLVAKHTSFSISNLNELESDQALDLLMAEVIEPSLPSALVFIRDYPESHAALARLETAEEGYKVARRFEVYLNRIELANGYWELTDMVEQRARFQHENQLRVERGMPEVEIDEQLLQELDQKMPNCAGVALGVDRMLMAQLGANSLADVLLFND